MLLLTNIGIKASNHCHYGASLLSFLLICANISRFNYKHSTHPVLFLKYPHQNFQILAELKKKSLRAFCFHSFCTQTVFQQLFSTLSVAVIGNVHRGTLCEQIHRAFNLQSRWQLSSVNRNIQRFFGHILYIHK